MPLPSRAASLLHRAVSDGGAGIVLAALVAALVVMRDRDERASQRAFSGDS